MTSDEQAALAFIKYLSLSKGTTIEVALLRDRIFRAQEDVMYGRVQAA